MHTYTHTHTHTHTRKCTTCSRTHPHHTYTNMHNTHTPSQIHTPNTKCTRMHPHTLTPTHTDHRSCLLRHQLPRLFGWHHYRSLSAVLSSRTPIRSSSLCVCAYRCDNQTLRRETGASSSAVHGRLLPYLHSMHEFFYICLIRIWKTFTSTTKS